MIWPPNLFDPLAPKNRIWGFNYSQLIALDERIILRHLLLELRAYTLGTPRRVERAVKYWYSHQASPRYMSPSRGCLGPFAFVAIPACWRYYVWSYCPQKYAERQEIDGRRDGKGESFGSVMICGAFGGAKACMLAILEGKQNSEKYVSTLENYLVRFVDELGGDGLVFQQENAPIHQSRYTKSWFAD